MVEFLWFIRFNEIWCVLKCKIVNKAFKIGLAMKLHKLVQFGHHLGKLALRAHCLGVVGVQPVLPMWPERAAGSQCARQAPSTRGRCATCARSLQAWCLHPCVRQAHCLRTTYSSCSLSMPRVRAQHALCAPSMCQLGLNDPDSMQKIILSLGFFQKPLKWILNTLNEFFIE